MIIFIEYKHYLIVLFMEDSACKFYYACKYLTSPGQSNEFTMALMDSSYTLIHNLNTIIQSFTYMNKAQYENANRLYNIGLVEMKTHPIFMIKTMDHIKMIDHIRIRNGHRQKVDEYGIYPYDLEHYDIEPGGVRDLPEHNSPFEILGLYTYEKWINKNELHCIDELKYIGKYHTMNAIEYEDKTDKEEIYMKINGCVILDKTNFEDVSKTLKLRFDAGDELNIIITSYEFMSLVRKLTLSWESSPISMNDLEIWLNQNCYLQFPGLLQV